MYFSVEKLHNCLLN